MIYESIPDKINLFSKYRTLLDNFDCVRSLGTVKSIIGSIIKSDGPDTKLGEICRISTVHEAEHISAEVVGFENGLVVLSPLGSIAGIAPGCRVTSTGEPAYVYVGNELIGRVFDSLGKPLDGHHPVVTEKKRSLYQTPVNPLERPLITNPLYSGVKSIDSFLTLGQGQRIGIFAGSGVGKSTLLGMIARYSQADLNVIALIGERGREVNEFIKNDLGDIGLKKSIVIVSTSQDPASNKIRAALLASTIAEYFRDQGQNVMLLMDSITRLAMAQREIGLSAGEPGTIKGYPPSTFALLPQVLERAGTSKIGSITGIYTVLVEGDDMNDPVADAARGILDGHIVLSRDLTNKAHFPAIDVVDSLSRLASSVLDKENIELATYFRRLLAVYKQNEEIINLGAYVVGANAMLDKAIKIKQDLDNFLRQYKEDYFSSEEIWEQLKRIYSLVEVTKNIPLKKVG